MSKQQSAEITIFIDFVQLLDDAFDDITDDFFMTVILNSSNNLIAIKVIASHAQ